MHNFFISKHSLKFQYLAVTIFIIYWVSVILFSFEPDFANDSILTSASHFKNNFSYSWKLFTPPNTYNNRLYFIIRDTNTKCIDTIEILEKIATEKQKKAPFNQSENIIDHLVNNSLKRLMRIIWDKIETNHPARANDLDSASFTRAPDDVANNENFVRHVQTLNNYCRLLLKERQISTIDKELKIIIAYKMIRPFNEINNENFVQRDSFAFEIPYKQLTPW